MRLGLVVGSVLSVGALLALAACTAAPTLAGDDDDSLGDDDGLGDDGTGAPVGSSSSGGPAADGGVTGSGTLIKTNAALVGITADGYVVYETLDTPATLEAVPVAGGAALPITNGLQTNDVLTIRGGAVAWWTGVTSDIGTLNVWTAATGAKTSVTTGSSTHVFAATDDGTRIAFSVGASASTANLAVSATSSIVTTAVLSGGNALDMAAAVTTATTGAPCPVQLTFAGKVLFTSYCTGTSTTSNAARLVTVADGTNPATKRIDGNNGNGSIFSQFSVDPTGSTAFGITTAGQGKLFTSGGNATSLDNTTAFGQVLSDGSAAIYRVATNPPTLKRAAIPGGAKTSLVSAGTPITEVLAFSADAKHLAFAELAADATNKTIDIHVVDTTSANQTPIDIVKSATAVPFGFTGSGSHVIYGTLTGGILALKAMPATGGAEIALAPNVLGAITLDTGSGVVFFDNGKQSGQSVLSDMEYMDVSAGAGGKVTKLATAVPQGGFEASGSKIFFTSAAGGKAGVYSAPLP